MKTTPIFEGKASRLLTRLEYEGSVVELEHETALAEVTKFKAWGMSGPGCKITVVEVSEVPGLERPSLPDEAAVVELEAVVAQVQLRASMP